MISLIRGNLQLVDNPGLGYCGIFALELLIAKLAIDKRLQEQRADAENDGKIIYRTRISLRGNPGDHCETCADAMKFLIANANGSDLSSRSYNVIDYWKNNPQVLKLLFVIICL